MARLILRRLTTAVIQLFVLAVVVFYAIRLLPADPVARLVGLNASPENYAAAEAHLGLDRSLPAQLASFLGIQPGTYGTGLFQGDLGQSWVTSTEVLTEILTFFPVTLQLVTLAFLLASLIAIPSALYASLNPGGKFDKAIFAYGMFAGSQPEFWWGLLFIYVFFYQLNIVPAPLGMISPLTRAPEAITGFILIDAVLTWNWTAFWDAVRHLCLPVVTLAMIVSGPILKMTRQNVSKTLRSDFITYSVAAGLKRRTIAKYAMRSASAPSLTIIGVLYGYMLGGAVLVESVFSLNGIGQYAVRSILNFDYPAIQGIVLVITAVSLMVYLCLDILQAALDPRLVK